MISRPLIFLTLWFVCSCLLIFTNRYILVEVGLPYPITLTTGHMLVATLATRLLRRYTDWLGNVDAIQEQLSWTVWSYKVLPIGVLFSLSLLCANYAYLFLSVSFIQMLKSSTPVAILLVSWAFGTEKPNRWVLLNVLMITVGASIVSYGEIRFNAVGFVIMISGVCIEAIRLVMIQDLLHGASMKMDPLTSLYYFAPISAVCGIFTSLIFEVPQITIPVLHWTQMLLLVSNMLVSFALNAAVVFTVKETSTLVLGLAGVLKDMLIVILSAIIWVTPPSPLQILGYIISMGGLIYFKFRAEIWARYGKYITVDSDEEKSPTGASSSPTKGSTVEATAAIRKSKALPFIAAVIINSVIFSPMLMLYFSQPTCKTTDLLMGDVSEAAELAALNETLVETKLAVVNETVPPPEVWLHIPFDPKVLKSEAPEGPYTEPPYDEIFPLVAKTGNAPRINAHNVVPNDTFRSPVFFGFTSNWNLLQQSVVSYLAAGWPPHEIYVVDNCGVMDYNERLQLSAGNPWYLNYTRLAQLKVNVIRTPSFLSFAQLQNFFTDYAMRHHWPYYLWSHSDVVVLPDEEQPEYKNMHARVGKCMEDAKDKKNWAVMYFHYDWFSVVNVATMRFAGGYDTQVPHYYADCDMYNRMRLRGMQILECTVGDVFDMAATIPNLAEFYPDPADGDKLNTARYQRLKSRFREMQVEKESRGRNYWQTIGQGGQRDPFWRHPKGFNKGFQFISDRGAELFSMKWGTQNCHILDEGKNLSSIWEKVD